MTTFDVDELRGGSGAAGWRGVPGFFGMCLTEAILPPRQPLG